MNMDIEEYKNHIKKTKGKMFRSAVKLLGDYEEAEEAVQEVFIKIWEKRDTIRNNSNIEAYMMTVLRNHCLDKFKSKHYKYRGAPVEDYEYMLDNREVPIDKQIEYINAAELINEIISKFPERWQTIIRMRDMQGYSNSEVAEILNIEENIVKVTLSRTRKRIREILINQYNYKYEH